MCRSTNADDRRVFSDGLLEEFHTRYDTRSTAHSGFVLVQCLPPNYFLSTGSIGSNGEMKRAWVHFNSVFLLFQIFKNSVIIIIYCRYWNAPRPEHFLYSVVLISLPAFNGTDTVLAPLYAVDRELLIITVTL